MFIFLCRCFVLGHSPRRTAVGDFLSSLAVRPSQNVPRLQALASIGVSSLLTIFFSSFLQSPFRIPGCVLVSAVENCCLRSSKTFRLEYFWSRVQKFAHLHITASRHFVHRIINVR